MAANASWHDDLNPEVFMWKAYGFVRFMPEYFFALGLF